MDKAITTINDTKEFIQYWDWIQEIPPLDDTHEQILGHCLLGNYLGLKLYLNGRVVGIVIYKPINSFIFIVGVYVKKHMNLFVEDAYAFFKKNGYSEVRAYTTHNEESFAKITKMQKVCSLFRKEI